MCHLKPVHANTERISQKNAKITAFERFHGSIIVAGFINIPTRLKRSEKPLIPAAAPAPLAHKKNSPQFAAFMR